MFLQTGFGNAFCCIPIPKLAWMPLRLASCCLPLKAAEYRVPDTEVSCIIFKSFSECGILFFRMFYDEKFQIH